MTGLPRFAANSEATREQQQQVAASSPTIGAWAQTRQFTDHDGALMVLIPAGSFEMGLEPQAVQAFIDTHAKGLEADALPGGDFFAVELFGVLCPADIDTGCHEVDEVAGLVLEFVSSFFGDAGRPVGDERG